MRVEEDDSRQYRNVVMRSGKDPGDVGVGEGVFEICLMGKMGFGGEQSSVVLM